MNLIDQSWAWENKPENVLEKIEMAGRTCYKSFDKIASDSSERFAKMIMKSGHESVIEHISASVRFITNRGVTHELVRHRLASFSQESTRYCNYDGKLQFIKPVWFDESEENQKACFIGAIETAELFYNQAIKNGWSPEKAREVLPNAIRTEIVMTANLREWRHVFKLRTSKRAHPQMRALMLECLNGFKAEIPVIFDDIKGAE